MITALSTPGQGRVLPDANNTVIKIHSTNGEGYYFRAEIYVENVLFDVQGWSREDGHTASKDLKKLYNAYFKTEPDSFVQSLQLQTHLLKTVKIIIKEYDLNTDGLVNTLELPSFKFMYTVKPVVFTDNYRLRFLGMDANVMQMPIDGKIVIPFYVKAENHQVKIELKTNFGTILNTRTTAVLNGKFVYLYQYNLDNHEFSPGTIYVTATFSCDTTIITQQYRINRLPDYPMKEIAFQNNYGFYIYAYLDGEMEINNAFKVETYDRNDDSQQVSEIVEEATYTINTGSLKGDEKNIINMIANSLDTKISIGSRQHTMVTSTKKQLEHKDKKHIYNENLQFTLHKGTDVANLGFVTVSSPQPDIQITNHSVSGKKATIHYVLNNGFSASQYELMFRTSSSTPWYSAVFYGPSPMTITLPNGVYSVRMAPYDDKLNVSNQITVTI